MPTSIWLNPLLNIRLLELYNLHLFSREIARQLSAEFSLTITRGAVIGRVRRLGLMHHRVDKTTKMVALLEAPIAPVEIELPADAPRSIIELRADACHYPIGFRTGRFGEQLHVFCGQPSNNVRPYCDQHYQITHQRM